MALPNISITDFIGEIALSNEQFATARFDAFVAQLYPRLIRDLLSPAAYVEVRDNEPLRGIWGSVMNGAEWVDSNGDVRIFNGFVDVVRYQVYHKWYYESQLIHAATGAVMNLNENATPQKGEVITMANTRYNESIDMLCDLYEFINDNQKQTVICTSSASAGGTLYDVFVPSTLYVFAGALPNNTNFRVTINGVGYDVLAVDDNVSIQIDGGAVGLDFTGAQVIWEPFDTYNLVTQKAAYTW